MCQRLFHPIQGVLAAVIVVSCALNAAAQNIDEAT